MNVEDLREWLKTGVKDSGVDLDTISSWAGVYPATIAQWMDGNNLRTVANFLSTMQALGYRLRISKPQTDIPDLPEDRGFMNVG